MSFVFRHQSCPCPPWGVAWLFCLHREPNIFPGTVLQSQQVLCLHRWNTYPSHLLTPAAPGISIYLRDHLGNIPVSHTSTCFHPVLNLQNIFPISQQGGRNKWQCIHHKSFFFSNAGKRGRKLTYIENLLCAKHCTPLKQCCKMLGYVHFRDIWEC